MVTLKYSCKLLTDVVLNVKSASEGANTTLDFIPGSNFLGIVASCYNSISKDVSFDLFHSGKVRFGDAHFAHGQNRTLKVAASFFQPKLDKSEYYVHHAITDPSEEKLRRKQLKQCRAGFFDFLQDKAVRIESIKRFSIKSKRNKISGASEDAAMFGYESLVAGSKFYFSIELDDDVIYLQEYIDKYLIGQKRVGRSRTAQYGLVEIKVDPNFEEVQSSNIKNGNQVVVYAESRLVFLDNVGMPKSIPSAMDLGFSEGSQIIWDKSQIRTFQYSPWNFKRQCYDTDRYGIEKGSVFVVETPDTQFANRYVGSFTSEGFGKVIYNPKFLRGQKDGKAEIEFAKDAVNVAVTPENDAHIETRLNTSMMAAIRAHVKADGEKKVVYDIVYEIMKAWLGERDIYHFKDETMPSQWGKIRSLAMQARNDEDLYNSLFAESDGYLEGGVAVVEKWKKYGRRDALKKLFVEKEGNNLRLIIINLSSQMAKL